MTRAELIADVEVFTARDDLADQIGSFLRLMEDSFQTGSEGQEPLRSDYMLKTVVLTLTDGRVALPVDWLDCQRIYTETCPSLTYVAAYRYDGVKGEYTIEGRHILCAEEAPITLVYFAKVPSLVVDDDSNWVLDNHYPVYFNGLMARAYEFASDDAMQQLYHARFIASILSVNEASRQREWSGGPLIMKVR